MSAHTPIHTLETLIDYITATFMVCLELCRNHQCRNKC